MQTDFNLNVRVTVGVTPALETLLNSLSLKAPQVPGAVVELQSTPAVDNPKVKDVPIVEKPETEEDDDAPLAAKAPKKFTKADIRAAIDETRRRLIGDDYKENATSDNYKKYYRALTQKFKKIAVFLGADRPSALPEDKIRDFVSQCDELAIADDGTISPAAPF
ncbi:MAG: hypothetical protein ACOYJK_09735 [Prevotella sp.]|jgi:hypothetical protein